MANKTRADTSECCMSGCVHCVYTIYADELEEYNEALGAAKDALVKAGIPTSQWPDEVRAKDGSTSDQVEKQVEKVMESVDPSMAAFLAYVPFRRHLQVGPRAEANV
jgi:hypothetical protein